MSTGTAEASPAPAESSSDGGSGRFRLFLALVVLSNAAGAGYTTGSIWVVGSPSVTLWFPLMNDLGIALVSMIGATVGSLLTRRLDYGAAVALVSTLEGAAYLTGSVVFFALPVGLTESRLAGTVIVLDLVAAFLASLGAPAWTAMLYSWPFGSPSVDLRLLRESAAFQVARSLGPLAGALVLASRPARGAIAILALGNAATFLVVTAFFLISTRRAPFGRDTGTPAKRAPLRAGARGRMTLPLGIIILTAFSFDASRSYLARLARMAGLTETEVGLILSVIALGSTFCGLLPAKLIDRWPANRRARLGAFLTLMAIICWLITGPWWLWVTGGLVGGIGLALANAAATRWHLDHRALVGQAAAEIRVGRTAASTVGGLAIIGSIAGGLPPLGIPLIFSVLAVVAAFRRKGILPVKSD